MISRRPTIAVPPPLLIALLLVLPPVALANMRAPVTLHEPSGALLPVKTGLTVNRAELSLQCRQDCAVTVHYQIASSMDCAANLTFILSDPDPIRASVNGVPVPVSTTAPFTPDHERPTRRDQPRLEYSDDLYRASFPARLRTGDNQVTVSYRQQYGTDEKEFSGYFSGWRQLREIRYELWPLREWRLDDSFTLSVRAYFIPDNNDEHLLVRGYATRFSSVILRKCDVVQGDHPFTATWHRDFPGRIEWLLGPADLCRAEAAQP